MGSEMLPVNHTDATITRRARCPAASAESLALAPLLQRLEGLLPHCLALGHLCRQGGSAALQDIEDCEGQNWRQVQAAQRRQKP